jgi:hypothetical protein
VSWLDRLFRRPAAPPPVTVTRGDDLAVFVAPGEGATVQMALGRAGWNSRVFERLSEGMWAGLIRNQPVAFVIHEGAASPERIHAAVRARAALDGLPVLYVGEAPPPEGVRGLPPATWLQLLDPLQRSGAPSEG